MLWWQQWQSSLHFPCSRLTQWPAEVTEAGWRTVEGWGSLRSTPVTVWAKVCLIADLSHIQQYFSLSTNTHVTHKTMHSHISIYLSICVQTLSAKEGELLNTTIILENQSDVCFMKESDGVSTISLGSRSYESLPRIDVKIYHDTRSPHAVI